MMREPPRILIVDDSIDSASSLENILTGKYGVHPGIKCSVTIAIGGEMALRLMQDSRPFDFVLTDANMGPMDGFMLTRSIRQNPDNADVVIFMMTGHGWEYRAEALAAGCQLYLSKPINPDDLIHYIELFYFYE